MKKPLRERIKDSDTTLNNVFPVFKVPVSYYYLGAALLARSRYLNWVYQKKILYHQSKWKFDLVVMTRFAKDLIESEELEERDEGYKLMYYLIIAPFNEINLKKGEKKYVKYDENTNDSERNL